MVNRPTRLIAAALALLPIGCSALNTRPGHPDSFDTQYYNPKDAWPTSAADRKTETMTALAGSSTPVFLTAKTPNRIWNARGYAYNAKLRYQAAAYKAQDVEDTLAIPVFGLAVATVATALGRASTVAIAATGLGGASASAGVSYLHPDKDAVTDQVAASALLCVVDQSSVLNDMSAIPLVLDKAALQDALTKLQIDAAGLTTSLKPTDQSAKAAVQTVVAAAHTAIESLDAAIAQYVMLPGEIYQTTDTIDTAAKSASGRTLDYGTILKNLQTSATNQSNTTQAKAQVQDASVAAANATTDGAASSAAAKVAVPQASGAAVATNLSTATNQVAAAVSTNTTTPPAAPESPQPGTGKSSTLSSILSDTTVSEMVRVTILSKLALDDIPNPNFSAIAANINNCALKK